MKAEIISVGTELLLGQIINTNAHYLANRLAQLGIDLFYQTTVGDNKKRIIDSISIAVKRADLILFTGGLGPTGDDLTKEALSEYLNVPLEINELELERIKELFQRRNICWVENNAKQAAFIPNSYILKNELGTAPGMAVKINEKMFILLPGPPNEMKHMMKNYAEEWLKDNTDIPNNTLYSKVLKFMGITESRLDDILQDLLARENDPSLALLAKQGEIHLRISAKANNEEDFMSIIKPVYNEVIQRVGDKLVAQNDESIMDRIIPVLIEKKLSISTAESCTGGLLSSCITSIPGSSSYFYGSVVAYNNEMKKSLLDVPVEMLNVHGAVSYQVASAMAQGIRKKTGSSIGIGITGIAGPSGATANKPVGLVYIALNTSDVNWSNRYYFIGNREDIRNRCVKTAQHILKKYLDEYIYEKKEYN